MLLRSWIWLLTASPLYVVSNPMLLRYLAMMQAICSRVMFSSGRKVLSGKPSTMPDAVAHCT